jgi:4-hydroxythreonine-4-phosphate dehydrogenase
MPRIAITLGDPRGIGPEIVEKVLKDPPSGAEFVVVGPDELVESLPAAERIGVGALIKAAPGVKRESSRPAIVDPFFKSEAAEASAALSPEDAGRLVGRSIEKAVEMAMAHNVAAIVTAPAEKRALHLAGYPYPGHTEWLAKLAGGVDVAMMLIAQKLRVVLITTHLPLREVPNALTVERVVRVGEVTKRAFRKRFGISEPRIAVCALNPHAGESGLFGTEDDAVLRPAAEQLDAEGPLSADTVFVRCMKGEFDVVLAPYHDVGMTAIKVAAFGHAVNITLGLPFIRTAPDHGTAMDIAGKGVADPSSMREAIEVAVRLALRGERESGAIQV